VSFTTSNIASAIAAWKKGAGVMLAPQTVDLYGGATVSIKLHVSTRRANETDVTAGAVADEQLIAIIDSDDWDTKAGREPQKGDVIWWMGKRFAVERSIGAAPGGDKAFYRARLQG